MGKLLHYEGITYLLVGPRKIHEFTERFLRAFIYLIYISLLLLSHFDFSLTLKGNAWNIVGPFFLVGTIHYTDTCLRLFENSVLLLMLRHAIIKVKLKP